MQIQPLMNIKLIENVMTEGQITSYVNNVSTQITSHVENLYTSKDFANKTFLTKISADQTFIHKSGDTGIGTLGLSGNLMQGKNSRASEERTIALGLNSEAKDKDTFVWNGDEDVDNYTSNGPGTFNINPVNGLEGFYIGHKTIDDLALTYRKFLEFTFTGTLGVSMSANILSDTMDGGFYGMCYAGNADVILGTYQSGIYYYNEFEGTVTPAQLTAIDDSVIGLDLENEKECFRHYRFRTIVKGDDCFMAVNYQTKLTIKDWEGNPVEVPAFKNKFHRCFYKSTNGYEWKLVYHEEADTCNTRIESPFVYISGKYYYAPGSGVFWSEDGRSWTKIPEFTTYVAALVADTYNNRVILVNRGGDIYYIDPATNNVTKQACTFTEISKNSGPATWVTYIDEDVAMIATGEYVFFGKGKDKFKDVGSYDCQKINVAIDEDTKKQFKPSQTTFGTVRGFTKAYDLWFMGTYHGFIMVSTDLKSWIPVYYEPLNMKKRGGIESIGIYDRQFYYITRCIDEEYPILKKLYILNDTVVLKKLINDYYTKLDCNERFVSLSANQDVYGYKIFRDGLDIGDYIEDVGNNTFAVGNNLTVGSYNFFYKGIDLHDDGHALVYLTDAQPRYPYPFVIYNGNKSNFKILGNTVTIANTASYSALSAGTNLTRVWNCTLDPDPAHMTADNHTWRPDYNQLCIDLGVGYQTQTSQIQTKLQSYMTNAFTGDVKVSPYLVGKNLVGQTITIVNGDKIAYLRCGIVKSIINNNTLCVLFNNTAINSSTGLSTDGSRGFSDFDYDDASLVFIDLPTLSGPANTSTYSSMNVGILNEVVRRGSVACGKQLTSEADFAFAFGRRGKAQHYASFLWAPATGNPITTDKSGTFNIGVNTTLANAHNPSYESDIRIIGSDNKRERLYKYIWGCMSSDNNFKAEFKHWLNS